MIFDVTRDRITRHEETTPTRLWSAPIAPNLKVNIDAAWHSPSCRAGAGIIIRNARGAFVGAEAVPFSAEQVSLVSVLNRTQRNLRTTSVVTSEGDDGVCTPFSPKFPNITTTSITSPGLGHAHLETTLQII
ncbi:PREDICTED: PRUPE_2G092000 [Prunus dulcis]|uniref:PREDICTED: PRUPE_2G092000 n=1 Tax=Prunus dulcis TaxID=3755 RepID=A0A5E4GGR7_PRUDU|nr:PREDICTED: PRUPE_2G092000 [Prunus dulcis]